MPGTKRPNRKPKKKRTPADTEKSGTQHKPGVAAGAKNYGPPKGGRSFTSPTMTRGSARGG
ncbi:MAG: hypothetical protein COW30_15600 [Rhodospirillales bacterium CG15_BIG_FIL_POST_REV_8_21_14_020_66_15]|nr:MAG: hypothetical protein COW30_15600 [Rhodospirillales bacterium CG15_BIG_FIL_POST_REV_8_21_14_020_66_15]